VVHGDGGQHRRLRRTSWIVNYECSNRHVAWLSRLLASRHGRRRVRTSSRKGLLRAPRTCRPDVQEHPGREDQGAHDRLTGTPPDSNQLEEFPHDLAVPRMDRRGEALPELIMAARGDRSSGKPPPGGGDPALRAGPRRGTSTMGIVRRKKVDVAADIPGSYSRPNTHVELDLGGGVRSIRRGRGRRSWRIVESYRSVSPRTRVDRRHQSVWWAARAREENPAGGREGRRTTSSRWCAESARPRPRRPTESPSTGPQPSAKWCSCQAHRT